MQLDDDDNRICVVFPCGQKGEEKKEQVKRNKEDGNLETSKNDEISGERERINEKMTGTGRRGGVKYLIIH